MISLYNIAQQAQRKIEKASWQEILQATRNCYASVVKQEWYEAKGLDVNEIQGAFIVTFKNIKIQLDKDLNQYFIEIPSTYLGLPQENGINWVCFMTDLDNCFVMCNAGTIGRMNQIQAGVMGGDQLYYVVNSDNSMRMYLPRMNNECCLKPILLRLTLALDTYNVDAPLNVPPNIQKQIVDMVVASFAPLSAPINENIK